MNSARKRASDCRSPSSVSTTDLSAANSTSTVVWFIWKRLFLFQDTGQAYAAAVGLLLAILLLTGIAFGLLGGRRRRRRRRVT